MFRVRMKLFSPSLIAKMIIMRALIVKLPEVFEFSSFKSHYHRGTQIIHKFCVSYWSNWIEFLCSKTLMQVSIMVYPVWSFFWYFLEFYIIFTILFVIKFVSAAVDFFWTIPEKTCKILFFLISILKTCKAL